MRDDPDPHGAFRHALGEEQGDQGTGESDERGVDEHGVQVEVHLVFRQQIVETEQLEDQADYDQHGEVRCQEQQNAFHCEGSELTRGDLAPIAVAAWERRGGAHPGSVPPPPRPWVLLARLPAAGAIGIGWEF